MNEDILYIWLSKIPGVGPVLGSALLKHFKSIFKIFNATVDELVVVDGIGNKIANKIYYNKDLELANNIYSNCIKNKIKLMKKYTNTYISNLEEYNNAPIILYYKGILKPINKPIAIVGARRCTEYGKMITVETTEVFAKEDMTIISGLAKGIDSYAHTIALKNSGYTIAVLGTSVDICYPNEHKKLYDEIESRGLLISQFEPGKSNIRENFIKRNELIAMLSDYVLIPEATKDSGSTYTAYFALKYNKEVFAAPNSIFDKYSEGTNKLISQGAKIYLGTQSIIGKEKKIEKTNNNLSDILKFIKEKPRTLDELKSTIKDVELENKLFELEITDKIQCIGGLYK